MVAKLVGRKTLPTKSKSQEVEAFEKADPSSQLVRAVVASKKSCEETKTMTNRRRFLPTIIAAALMAIFLPLIASAQGNDSWNRDRGDDRDYRRDNDDWRNRNRYDSRVLRDVTRRLDDRSGDFQRHLDNALDRSRYDGTRREDRINDIARDFRIAASNLRRSASDGRNLNRSSDEARRVLQIGSRIDQFVGRQRLDSRAASDWAQIRQDLRVIADIYNLNFNGGGWGRR
jgi:hypothetical protein